MSGRYDGPIGSEAVASLEPVGLQELNGRAALQSRRDRKYIVPAETAELLLAGCGDGLRVLTIEGTRTFRYESVYFDTPELVTYLSAARSRPARFKVRTRTYLDSGNCFLELKHRDRTGVTVKSRLPYPSAERYQLNRMALDFLEGFPATAPVSARLVPTLTTRYRRTTLLETASASRITIDTCLECRAPGGRSLEIPGLVLIETKTSDAPCAFDRLLWSNHHRPKRVSKYCTGMAALHPELPANKWTRVLREHFGGPPHDAEPLGHREEHPAGRTTAA